MENMRKMSTGDNGRSQLYENDRCSGRVAKEWEVWCATWQVRPGKVGLLWREMAIYIARKWSGPF